VLGRFEPSKPTTRHPLLLELLTLKGQHGPKKYLTVSSSPPAVAVASTGEEQHKNDD
jgi:hypothetical protein